MARLPRLTVPGYPHHVIQRGNNRQAIFASDEDKSHFLTLLRDIAAAQGVAVHAYVLMDNHIHLLLTPSSDKGIPQMMQALGRRYVRYFNDRLHRTGTLWEGRYRSTLIEAERYLLACMVYIDLNPVRAGMVAQPDDYAWSSYGHYVGHKADPLITPHPLLWNLGNTPFARESAYAALVRSGLTPMQQTALTQSVMTGWALGETGFVQALQAQTPRRITKTTAGRPPRQPRNSGEESN